MVGGLAGVLALPMVVALAVLYRPRWMPLEEVAQMEMRVRDVASGHPPALGLNGRFEAFSKIGSHPGPLAYYALWPVYRLFGGDGWGLMVSTTTLSLLAAGLAVWIAYRRGGWQAALGVAAVLVVLMRAYSATILAEPWNPQVPLIWWVTFLLAVWALLAGDLVMLPVAVFAGSLCMQTHVPYAPLVVGMFGVAVVAGLLALRREGRSAVPGRVLAWIGGSLGLGVALWLPPVIEQFTNHPGNLAILVRSLRQPEEDRVPLKLAFESWAAHLNVWELANGGLASFGPSLPGLLFLVVWALAVVVAVRRADRELIRLHLVVGLATGFGLLITLSITGPLWAYLVLWGWGTTALMVFATVWTLWRAVPATRERLVATAVWVGTVAVVTLFTVDASTAEMNGTALSRRLDRLATATVEYLADDPAQCGDSCRYQVTWADNLYVGAEGAGLLLELERRGFDVGAAPQFAEAVRPHRVIREEEADALIHVAVTEDAINFARTELGMEVLASFDMYSAEEHAAHARLRSALVAALQAEGYDDLTGLAASGDNDAVPIEDGMSHELKSLILQANRVYRPSAALVKLR